MENNEEKIIEERKEKVIKFFKSNPNWIFLVVLILLVILGVYIRYQPLADHDPNVAGTQPGLWDSTTKDYTLGPDLDPFLFLRYARTIIENGSLPRIDEMRNVPVGFDTTTELQMVSYMIVFTYRIISIFGMHNINYAAAFMPVLFFIFTIISFFFFVREIFIRKSEENKKINALKANLIASVSTLFMIIIPGFLSRTVAGIPEKESVGFFFLFLTFYLFLKAWKTEKTYASFIISILAGTSSALMGLTWGGVTYIYVTIGLAGLIGFILNKFGKREAVVYALWLISSFAITLLFTNRVNIKEFATSIDTGLCLFVIALLFVHYTIWKTKIKESFKLEKIKIPKSIITLAITILLALFIVLIINPALISEKISGLYGTLIKPVTGRWSTTVAENAQPYFSSWYGDFGKVIFWLFFAGSVLLFYKIFNHLAKKDKIMLTLLYIFFFFGLVFSRYSPSAAILNGGTLISKFFYFGSALLLVIGIIYIYINYHISENLGFEKADFEYILLFCLFVLTLFTARSAVRLIMVLVPIAPIFLSYLLVESGFKIKESEKKDLKIIFAIIFIFTFVYSCYYGWGYYQGIKYQAYGFIPYYYTIQWQEAMSWIRNTTSSNAVFAHWWDYGYWVQSIGDRATVTDGGNAIVWWNYLTGRYVLTGTDQQESLNFLWNHNATHLLIDSSDIGKYGAFSQIGSDKDYDRLSYGPLTMISDSKQIQETSNGIIRSYQGSSIVDGDLNYNLNGSNIFIPGPSIDSSGNPAYHAYIIGVFIEKEINNISETYKQPYAVYYYNNKQINLPLRYLYVKGKLYDYKSGVDVAVYLIPKLDAVNNGLSMDKDGALIYLSPKILSGYLGQVYLLDNSLGNFNNFKLVHTEQDYILRQIDTTHSLGDFVYYQGLRGPIKIWEISYTGKEQRDDDSLRTTVPSSITWAF